MRHPLPRLARLALSAAVLALAPLAAAQPAAPQGAPAPASAPAQAQAPALLGTTAADLPPEAQSALVELMKEGPCPCDPQLKLYACIQAGSCPDATRLAEFGVQRFKAGLGREQVIEAVINKFVEDFVPPFNFELAGTMVKGAEGAPLTVVEFADFECPHCALMKGIVKELMATYPGALRVYFKQFPLPFHTLAKEASKATLAAQRQGAAWEMHDLVFDSQSQLKPESFVEFAAQLGLNIERFKADMADPALEKQIERDKLEGMQAGLTGTPTLFFNGKRYGGEPSLEALKRHVGDLLGRGAPLVIPAPPAPPAPR